MPGTPWLAQELTDESEEEYSPHYSEAEDSLDGLEYVSEPSSDEMEEEEEEEVKV
jgi:hypothetical protein